ncbi:YncE family protein [Rossellomorea aquimaris]|uniref:YncE family protein n=1 Tax=Rossellomorea aquimaris TaxID=189382 RepID=A0A5D4TA55_9BACI|nr:YncE family protein [Rossellomorea aquimaris]TYS72517.1 YncE family protein [Rossellomorea aquimaris]
MNKMIFLMLISMLLLVSGCQGESLAVPENAEEAVMVSHLKDAGLTFIDKEKQQVIDSIELSSPIVDMVRVDDVHIAFTSKDGSLSLLNTENGDLEQWEGSGEGVNELLYSERTHQLFLADSGENRVRVFDLKKKEMTSEIAVGKFPLSMALDETEKLLYVVNQKSSSISAIEVDTLQVKKEMLVPYLPEGILVKDSKLYIGGHGPVHGELNRYVYVIDPESGEEVQRIEVGLMPVKFFSPPSGREVYVVCHGSHELYKIGGESTEKISAGANPYDVTGNEETLYVSSIDSNSLFIVDLQTFKVKTEMEISGGPVAIIEGGGVQ